MIALDHYVSVYYAGIFGRLTYSQSVFTEVFLMRGKSMLPYLLLSVFMVAQLHPGFLLSANAASLLYSNTFDTGLGDIDKVGGCYPYSFGNASPTGDGNNAVRIQVKGTEACVEPNGEMKHRAMVRYGTVNDLRFAPNKPYWIGFRVFVPDNYPTHRTDAIFVYGLMSGATPGESAIYIRGSNFTLLRRWNDATGFNEVKEYQTPVQTGKWTDFVIYLDRSWKSDGVLKIWMNNKLVVNKNGPNATDYPKDPYMRNGIYWGTEVRPEEYTLYFDNINIATGSDGYDLVYPGNSALPVPPTTPTGLQIQVQ